MFYLRAPRVSFYLQAIFYSKAVKPNFIICKQACAFLSMNQAILDCVSILALSTVSHIPCRLYVAPPSVLGS
uniref:Uncharacterized protein n=1 Tax=Romanomermis culicivorax TaxID=13658 RepID=A0A915KF84_ROMCU